MVFKDMNINRLPQECHERLSCLLKYGPSVDWEALALVGFPSIYSDPLKLAKIENSPHPASALLDDLCCRGVSVETLLEALKVIGNERAVSVILEEVPELGKNLLDREILPPSRIRSMQPEENYDTTEQTETLRRPAQETKIENQTPSSHPVSNTSLMELNYDTTEQTETLQRPAQETRIGNQAPSSHPVSNTSLMDLNYDTTEQTETLRRPAQETRIGNQTPSSHPVSNTSLMDLNYDTTEQTETLRRPVQETRIGNRTPSRHPANYTLLMDLIGAIFPCFGHFNRFY